MECDYPKGFTKSNPGESLVNFHHKQNKTAIWVLKKSLPFQNEKSNYGSVYLWP